MSEIIYPYVDEEDRIWFNEESIAYRWVETKWASCTKNRYTSLGYEFTKMGDPLIVDVRHLSKGSEVKVVAYCPVDMEPRSVIFSSIFKSKSTICINHCYSDISNNIFGNLIAIRPVGKNKKGSYVWECRCISCGLIVNKDQQCLASGETQSCGSRMCHPNFNDLMGERFGNLEVIEFMGTKFGNNLWKCACICGNETNVLAGNLLKKNGTRSCGKGGFCHPMYNHDLPPNERNRKTPEYREWRSTVYERDNWTCQACKGDRGGNLVAHHLRDFSTYPALVTVISNGITVCKDCHHNFHIWMGGYFVSCTEEDWLKFLRRDSVSY